MGYAFFVNLFKNNSKFGLIFSGAGRSRLLRFRKKPPYTKDLSFLNTHQKVTFISGSDKGTAMRFSGRENCVVRSEIKLGISVAPMIWMRESFSSLRSIRMNFAPEIYQPSLLVSQLRQN